MLSYRAVVKITWVNKKYLETCPTHSKFSVMFIIFIIFSLYSPLILPFITMNDNYQYTIGSWVSISGFTLFREPYPYFYAVGIFVLISNSYLELNTPKAKALYPHPELLLTTWVCYCDLRQACSTHSVFVRSCKSYLNRTFHTYPLLLMPLSSPQVFHAFLLNLTLSFHWHQTNF